MAQLSDAPPLRCTLSFEQRTRRWGVANELHSTAIVEPKVMMPIGDGLRLATGIYFVSRTDNSTSNIAASELHRSLAHPLQPECSLRRDSESSHPGNNDAPPSRENPNGYLVENPIQSSPK